MCGQLVCLSACVFMRKWVHYWPRTWNSIAYMHIVVQGY